MTVDLGPLPLPTEHDMVWAYRLWNALTLSDGGGAWDMHGVGRYRRTGIEELTLTEIHADKEPDQLGVTMWNKHDWICVLAYSIDWEIVSDEVQVADNDVLGVEDMGEPAIEDIGKSHVCDCAMIYSLQGPHTDALRLTVGDDGVCLNRECDKTLPAPFRGVLNVVDDRAMLARLDAQDIMKAMADEYPEPPQEILTIGEEE